MYKDWNWYSDLIEGFFIMRETDSSSLPTTSWLGMFQDADLVAVLNQRIAEQKLIQNDPEWFMKIDPEWFFGKPGNIVRQMEYAYRGIGPKP